MQKAMGGPYTVAADSQLYTYDDVLSYHYLRPDVVYTDIPRR
jgi:hypothetical protein